MSASRNPEFFLNAGHAADHLFMLIFPTVVLAMAPEFGLSYSEMLQLAIGGFVMFGAGSIPAGWLADRWSRRGMMVVFFVGIGSASLLTAMAREPWHIAVGLTLVGSFASIYHPVGIAMLVSGRDKVGRLLGVNGVWGNLGVASAAMISGALAYWINWRAAYVVPGVISIALGIAFACTVPRGSGSANGARKSAGRTFPRHVLVHVFAVTAIATICGGVIFNATTIAIPKVFDERLAGLVSTTLGVGMLAALVYAFAAVAQLCVGWWIDHGRIKTVFVTVVALQAPLLLWAGVSSHIAIVVAALGMMFFVFGQVPVNDAMVAAYSDERWRARAYSVRYVMSFAGSALAVPLIAYIHRVTGGFTVLFYVLAALALTSLIAAASLPRDESAPAPATA